MPKRVGHAVRWAGVRGGLYHACGIDTAHGLWCWGDNGYGQLGLGELPYAARPTRV